MANTMAMKSKHLELYMSAAVSIVGIILILYATVRFYPAYLANLDSRSEHDATYVWQGVDVVLAIRQKAMTAGTYISGLYHALAIIGIGAVVQCALMFRLTRSIPASLRALFQVELVYQAITAHKIEDSQVAQIERREAAATVAKMSNYGVYFAYAMHGLNIAASTVFQRPVRSTIIGRDLINVWSCIGMVLAVLAGVTAAKHLAGAVWSVWYVKPVASQKQLQQSDRGSQPADSDASVKDKATDASTIVSTKQIARAVLRVVACTISVMAHVTTYSLIAVSIRGLVAAVAVGHLGLASLAFYAVTRQPVDSIFWGYLTSTMHPAFNRHTHRRAWWLSVVWAILFSGVGIVCGALQSNVYLFTRQYSAANTSLYGVQVAVGVTTSGMQTGPVPLERHYGIFNACMAAADLLVHLTVVLYHMRNDAESFEASVEMPSIPVA